MKEQEQIFIDLLKSKGLKVTSQRKTVLQVIARHKGGHLTPEEIYELVKEESPDIGLATVYRTIQLLSELHLIDKLILNDGYVRYELSQDRKDEHRHHHLICLSCGKVTEFEDDLLDLLENKIKEQVEFQVVDHEVKLFGYCKNCKQ